MFKKDSFLVLPAGYRQLFSAEKWDGGGAGRCFEPPPGGVVSVEKVPLLYVIFLKFGGTLDAIWCDIF